jgi:hypothetical protein
LEKPAFSGFSALGNALLLGLFALSDGLLGVIFHRRGADDSRAEFF